MISILVFEWWLCIFFDNENISNFFFFLNNSAAVQLRPTQGGGHFPDPKHYGDKVNFELIEGCRAISDKGKSKCSDEHHLNQLAEKDHQLQRANEANVELKNELDQLIEENTRLNLKIKGLTLAKSQLESRLMLYESK